MCKQTPPVAPTTPEANLALQNCGQELYADMSCRFPEEINRLASILQHAGDSATAIHDSYNMGMLSNIHSSLPANLLTTTGSLSSNPVYSHEALAVNLSSASSSGSASSDTNSQESFLEICIGTSKYAKTLCEIELKDIQSDEELFTRLRKEYFAIRKPRSMFWLLKPSGVHYVKASQKFIGTINKEGN
jgi:hypothetical protein